MVLLVLSDTYNSASLLLKNNRATFRNTKEYYIRNQCLLAWAKWQETKIEKFEIALACSFIDYISINMDFFNSIRSKTARNTLIAASCKSNNKNIIKLLLSAATDMDTGSKEWFMGRAGIPELDSGRVTLSLFHGFCSGGQIELIKKHSVDFGFTVNALRNVADSGNFEAYMYVKNNLTDIQIEANSNISTFSCGGNLDIFKDIGCALNRRMILLEIAGKHTNIINYMENSPEFHYWDLILKAALLIGNYEFIRLALYKGSLDIHNFLLNDGFGYAITNNSENSIKAWNIKTINFLINLDIKLEESMALDAEFTANYEAAELIRNNIKINALK